MTLSQTTYDTAYEEKIGMTSRNAIIHRVVLKYGHSGDSSEFINHRPERWLIVGECLSKKARQRALLAVSAGDDGLLAQGFGSWGHGRKF